MTTTKYAVIGPSGNWLAIVEDEDAARAIAAAHDDAHVERWTFALGQGEPPIKDRMTVWIGAATQPPKT